MQTHFRSVKAKHHVSTGALIGMFSLSPLVHADYMDGMQEWQEDILFKPSSKQLERETKGHIMIYNGLTDKTVQRALDTQFERIGSMMFTHIIITDEQGNAITDPVTGEVVTEDDDC